MADAHGQVAQVSAALAGAMAKSDGASPEVKAAAASASEDKKDEKPAAPAMVYDAYTAYAADQKAGNAYSAYTAYQAKPRAPVEQKAAPPQDMYGLVGGAPLPAAGGGDQKSVYSAYEAQNAGADQKSVYSAYEAPPQAELKTPAARGEPMAVPELYRTQAGDDQKGFYGYRAAERPGADRKDAAPAPVAAPAMAGAEQKSVAPPPKAASPEVAAIQPTLHKRADEARGSEPKRAKFGDMEKKAEGWALMPLLADQVDFDGVQPYKKGTHYFVDSPEEAKGAANGPQMMTGRQQYLLRVEKGGQLVNAKGAGVDTTRARPGPRAMNIGWIKVVASMLREHGLNEAADQVLLVEPTLPLMKPVFEKAYQQIQAQEGGERKGESVEAESDRRYRESIASAGGKYIFAMNASGQIFAAQDETFVIHHSSFLAGGAVAAAGEISASGGTLTKISNNSGHYRTGPAYLWQAVKQLQSDGVAPSSFAVEVLGTGGEMRGDEFLDNFNPAADPSSPKYLSFVAKDAITAVAKYQKGRGASTPAKPAGSPAPGAAEHKADSKP